MDNWSVVNRRFSFRKFCLYEHHECSNDSKQWWKYHRFERKKRNLSQEWMVSVNWRNIGGLDLLVPFNSLETSPILFERNHWSETNLMETLTWKGPRQCPNHWCIREPCDSDYQLISHTSPTWLTEPLLKEHPQFSGSHSFTKNLSIAMLCSVQLWLVFISWFELYNWKLLPCHSIIVVSLHISVLISVIPCHCFYHHCRDMSRILCLSDQSF